jgi:hypothetical protein
MTIIAQVGNPEAAPPPARKSLAVVQAPSFSAASTALALQ